ncbi:hypothetical protein K7432_013528 [Basidiobolus ranarum]|uniref:Dynactin subunit 4 n=1 Tax=Basidiobolus ranarum TaxID=34480 RepID=A0ABR2VRD1_9FUNG
MHRGLENKETLTAHPFIHYYCGCSDLYKISSGQAAADISNSETTHSLHKDEIESGKESDSSEENELDTPPFDLSEHDVHLVTQPLSKLYFCESCHQLRCPRCVQSEIVCYYCPNCLFEVPTASVKYEKNRCGRNCFECPLCSNTLSVVLSEKSSTQGSPETPESLYYLHCGVCRWSSKEIEMTFERPTGLAMQLQKTEDEQPDVQEFDNLKQHFERFFRANNPPSLPPSLLSIPGVSGFTKTSMLLHTQQQQQQQEVTPYKSDVVVADDKDLIEELINMTDSSEITTLEQRLKQLNTQSYRTTGLYPQRIHLRTKRSKRCKSCRHILIKPDQKAQATRFKIKFTAMLYVPIINIVNQPYLEIGKPTQVILKFTNPLEQEMEIILATSQVTKDNQAQISVLAPQFKVYPYADMLEFDEEERRRRLVSETNNSTIGIHERKLNTTSIIIEVVPQAEVKNFMFPMLVTYSYTLKSDSEDGESETLTKKKYSFWTIIGLGSVDH